MKALPKGIQKNQVAVAETIENNVRKLIIDESPINPKYYESMSELLDALIAERKQAALNYAVYLAKVVELTKRIKNGAGGSAYPKSLDTQAKKALYDNLGKNEVLAVTVDAAVRASKQDDWRNNPFKVKKVLQAIKDALGKHQSPLGDKLTDSGPPYVTSGDKSSEERAGEVLELVKNQYEY